MKNKTNRQAMRKLANEANDYSFLLIRPILLDIAEKWGSEEFAKQHSKNDMIGISIYKQAAKDIQEFLGFED